MRFFPTIIFAISLQTATAFGASEYLHNRAGLKNTRATLRTTGGGVLNGTILSVSKKTVRFRYSRGGRKREYGFRISSIVSIQIGKYVYVPSRGGLRSSLAAQENRARRARAAEYQRGGTLTFENKTSKTVTVAVTKLRDRNGRDVSYRGTWKFKPGERAYLSNRGSKIHTSKVHYTLTTDDGSKRWYSTKKGTGSSFLITINRSDLHSPVLAKFSGWSLSQSISTKTGTYREPVRAYPIGGGAYEFTGGGTKTTTYEVRGSKAYAFSTVRNPTSKTLDVKVTIHFDFGLLRAPKVASNSMRLKPFSKATFSVPVSTKGWFGNKKLRRIKIVDITTTPVK